MLISSRSPADLKVGAIYRLAYNMEDRKLCGRLVTFHEYRVFTCGDIERARVTLIAGDGSNGEEFLVKFGCLISF